jgi:polysaccharide pyruvyl transferase WcaK-like protein
MNIFIIGYFNHYNTGDEQYKITFDYIFKNYLPNYENYLIKYIDCDLLKNTKIEDNDIIIVGGGDILNNYFINELLIKFMSSQNKIIAFSVGLPYTNILVESNKLCIFDYIYLRTNQDINLFNNFINSEKIIYIPDISYFLLNIKLDNPSFLYENIFRKLLLIKKKKICFSLNRHIYNSNNKDQYNLIIYNLSYFIIYLIQQNYHIVFLPFNTVKNTLDYDSNKENDILIHNDVYNKINEIDKNTINNITNIDFELKPLEIFNLYDLFEISIPMRFHACLFSIYKKIPFLPIYTQRKIKNLLLDINWNYEYKLPSNKKDIPINLESNKLLELFDEMINNNNLKNKLNYICENLFQKYLEENINSFIDKIINNYSKETIIKNNYIDNKIDILFNKLQNLAVIYNYKDFREIDNNEKKNIIVKFTSFSLTNNINSPYNFGLLEKMFDNNKLFDYKNEWKWIIKDFISKDYNISNNLNGIFNINYINQSDESKTHRFGWQYIYENIKYLNNINSNLYFDLYIDRTFHWEKNIFKLLGIIPYNKNWIGFIHHTFDTSFSNYNNYKLIRDPDFIYSLVYCKGIFVLSETLKKELKDQFDLLQIKVPIFSFVHPTKIDNIPKFSYKKYKLNNDKKLIHIGGWLRNIFSFYNLNIPKNIINKKYFFKKEKINSFRKVAIKNIHMNNYFPDISMFENIKFIKIDCDNSNIISNNCSQKIGESTNNWHKHAFEYLIKINNSVEIIERLENNEYDNILIENIVFINLVDASAINTLIECIIRNTPIIINKHPAVVELLGPNYPLYYDDIDQNIINLLLNKNIKKATKYLESLDKNKFDISFFINNLIDTIININNT